MERYTMTIDGQAVVGEQQYDVVNPANEQVFAQAPDCSPAQLNAALDAAQRAFFRWSCDETARRQALSACARAVRAHADAIARLLTQEQGKPLAKARAEVDLSASWFEYTAELPIPVDVVQDDAVALIEVRRKPLGVVGAITPWNYPIILAVCKIAPALLAGNTLVLKPSPYTPLATLRLGEALRTVLPQGVLNIVSGGDELGRALTNHPLPRKLSFTGSVEAGKQIAAAAAPDLKRVTLELGGNDAAIVLDDADPRRIARGLFWSAFENSGQFCAAVKRVYIHEQMYQPLVAALVAIAQQVRVGDGLDPHTELGPLSNRMQFERVCMLVEDARRGGKVLAGGSRLGRAGYFHQPTLIGGLPDDARLVAEEQFGPVLPLLMYNDIDDAVARANATSFGLGGSIWTSNPMRGAAIAAQLECGSTWINQHAALLPNVPFGGVKWSGVGVEYGVWGLLEFTDIQVLHVARASA